MPFMEHLILLFDGTDENHQILHSINKNEFTVTTNLSFSGESLMDSLQVVI
jgi:hypothetical protein